MAANQIHPEALSQVAVLQACLNITHHSTDHALQEEDGPGLLANALPPSANLGCLWDCNEEDCAAEKKLTGLLAGPDFDCEDLDMG